MNLIVCLFFAKELFEAYEMIAIIFHYIIETNGKMYETQNLFLCQNVCLDHKHYTHTLTLQKQMTSLCMCERCVWESVCVCVCYDIVQCANLHNPLPVSVLLSFWRSFMG